MIYYNINNILLSKEKIMAIGYVLLITSVVLFLLLMVVALPKSLLKVKYSIKEPDDIGIKRCFYNGKRCVVYEGGREISKYIEKYLLVEGKDCKILRCKVARKIAYLNYDVVVFNRYDQIVDIVNVKENLVKGGYTRRVELSNETSYVRIVIREADGLVIKRKPIAYIPAGKIMLYGFLTTILTVIEIFVLKIACAYAFGGVFREVFIRSTNGTIVTLIIAFIIGLVALISVAFGVKRYRKR